MRIGWIGSDWDFDRFDSNGFPVLNGAGWYRVHLPAEALRRNGFDVVVGSIPDTKKGWLTVKDWRGVEHDDCDVVIIQRWMHRGAAEAISRARSNGQAVIMDVDTWYDGLRYDHPAFAGTHPRAGMELVNRRHARQNKVSAATTEFNRDHLRQAVRASTAVICSTPFLVDKFSKGDQPVYLCRNAIDLDRWLLRPFASCGFNPTIGWTGDVSYRGGDLRVLKGILAPFLRQHGLRAFHGGAVETDDEEDPTFGLWAGVSDSLVDTAPMVPVSEMPSLLHRFQVGVLPHALSPFNDAQSAVGGLEMAAAGIPFVASPTAEYVWLHEEHGIGRIARSPRDWTRHLDQLLDPEIRDLEAAGQRERLTALDVNIHWVDWARALTGALVGAM